MAMPKKIFRCSVNWGWQALVFSSFVFAIITAYLFYFFAALIDIISTRDLFLMVLLPLTAVPVIFMIMIFLPVFRSMLFMLLRKKDDSVVLYTTGISIGKKMLEWKEIKGISFNTGRSRSEKLFYEGIRLPQLQKIYISDAEGKEYSAVIDIDYWLKDSRDKNNILKMKELLLGMDKMELIGDWAEPR